MAVANSKNVNKSFKKNLKEIYAISQSEPARCAVRDIFVPTADKWSLFCMYYLAYEPCRFNDLKKRIPDISSRMLSATLKKLSEAAIVNRKAYAEVPPRVEYSLTEFGYAYTEKMLELNLWLFKERAGKA